jgi:hypothetical protein
MEGFLVFQFAEKMRVAQKKMADWIRTGKIKYRESVVEGIENTPAEDRSEQHLIALSAGPTTLWIRRNSTEEATPKLKHLLRFFSLGFCVFHVFQNPVHPEPGQFRAFLGL